jgi:hypothetical protein
MSVFPDWEKYAVHQRRANSGCIPTGYEMLLRAAQVHGINFDTFQDDFDLDKDKSPFENRENNFESVANAIREKYPHVRIQRKIFPQGKGKEKLRLIEECLANNQPILVSLSLKPFGNSGWHIMPIVDANKTEVFLLRYVRPDGTNEVIKLSKSDLVRIHDEFKGGNDVAYIVTE